MFWQIPKKRNQKRLVPETVQTSNMDCGPAALRSLLEGFGITVNYGRLRELCQTSIDGTSIDVLETVANDLGLVADQVIVPRDHLLLPETDALPAMAVVQLPNGLPHFVVVWSSADNQVQVMDPQIGRRWLTADQLAEQLFIHELEMDAAAWREWAGTDGFIAPLRARLTAIAPSQSDLIDHALQHEDWQPLATVDAALRLVGRLVTANVVAAGEEAGSLLAALTTNDAEIPAPYWFVRPKTPNMLIVRGAVLLSVTGVTEVQTQAERVALTQPDPHPLREMWRLLRDDGLLAPTVITLAAVLAAIGLTLEAVVLRGVIDVGARLTLPAQRVTALTLFLSFALLMLVLEFLLSESVQRMGRHLDTRLRAAFLAKIPRLGDRYFQSRLISDMAMRAHELALIRQLPALGVRFLRVGIQLILTSVGAIILIPQMAGVILGVLVVAIAPSLLLQPLLRERDLRLRAHGGGLSRFYLDGLLGLVAIGAHSAEKSLQTAHETLLTEWVRAGRDYNLISLVIQGAQVIIGTVCAIWIVLRYLAISADPAGLLLLFYWVLNLPQLGQQFAQLALQYPQLRNRMLRIVEPLGAPEAVTEPATETPVAQGGMAISLVDVSVEAAGSHILREIGVEIGAGEHVAIVGASGAGKSSFVGLLQGWHEAADGLIAIDGEPLTGERLDSVRQQTAWVDPTVQIWNQLLVDNLLYGNSADALNTALQTVDLYDVLQKLPDGMQTMLGEGGGLVAGGEGQRVRLGRALLRPTARLVILDEPFRGLDRSQRQTLLATVRAYWSDATLLFISHDMSDVDTFERVLVMADGRLVEDGSPQELAVRPNSHFQQLKEAETSAKAQIWDSSRWRRLQLKDGVLTEIVNDA